MIAPSHQGAPRVLVVGEDGEIGPVLHLHLLRAGWSPVCVPAPDFVEAIAPIVAPHAIVLVLPEIPATSWAPAVTASATAAQAGVRVVLVAPSREVVEPLASVSGAERALSRTDVLADPGIVLGPPPPRGLPSPYPARRTGTTGAVALTASPRGPLDATSPSVPPGLPPALPATPAAAPSPPLAQTGDGAGVDLGDLLRDELVEAATRLSADVSLVSEHNFFVGRTRRLDSGGIFVSTSIPPPVGTSVEVRLGLPDARKLDVRGEVVFVRPRGALGGRQPAGCGVKLSSLPSWAAEVAERFFVVRPPILFHP